MKIEVALCLPRDATTIALTRRVIVAALGELGITRESVDAIRLALSEACTNVVEHSSIDDEYEVRLEVNDDRCEITVVDTWKGFDATRANAAFPPADSPGGRGLAIMRSVMDSTTFTSEPERGTLVHLTKTLDLTPNGALRRLLGPPPAAEDDAVA